MNAPGQRLADKLIGALLAGCGVAILMLLPPSEWPAWLLAFALIVVGGQAIRAGMRGGDSWLSRLGPLP